MTGMENGGGVSVRRRASRNASGAGPDRDTAFFRYFSDDGDWRTLLLLMAIYAVWAGLVFFGPGLFSALPGSLLAIVLIAPLLTLHSSTQHEFVHGHPFRAQWLNDALAFAPIGLLIPYCRFKETHLKHHLDCNLCDPFDDPESWYMDIAGWLRRNGAARAVFNVNNTFAGRLIVGPLIGTLGLLRNDFRRVVVGEHRLAARWLLHGALVGMLVTLIAAHGAVPVWAYLASCYLAMSLLMVRTFAEHQWSERPDGRTIIVERSPLSLLFLNNNLHLVHHKLPTVAWYRLPSIFRARRAEWLAMNDGYAFPNYFSLFRSYAFKPKEPVVHPVLRRVAEPGRAFRPRLRARTVFDAGTAPVPAEPPKE